MSCSIIFKLLFKASVSEVLMLCNSNDYFILNADFDFVCSILRQHQEIQTKKVPCMAG